MSAVAVLRKGATYSALAVGVAVAGVVAASPVLAVWVLVFADSPSPHLTTVAAIGIWGLLGVMVLWHLNRDPSEVTGE